MTCEVFGICGGCANFANYDFKNNANSVINEFKQHINLPKRIDFFESSKHSFRSKAEFRFCNVGDRLDYAMNSFGKNERVRIKKCPILLPNIQDSMPLLLESINKNEILRHKLYGCNFLSSTQKELLITLIYHKKLDSIWMEQTKILQENLSKKLNLIIHIIGRSKGQKIVLNKDFISDEIELDSKKIAYVKKESRFSQPNPQINKQMLQFVTNCCESSEFKQSDLLELYCGSGNFTIALSSFFRSILATEVVKDCIDLLRQNMNLNNVKNIHPARLNAQDSINALKRQREFFRLKSINLDSFNFSCVLIDPPRAGIADSIILEFLQTFNYIIYISCNPHSMLQDLKTLCKTHTIKKFALFEQFPYTKHIESIAFLSRI